jgi:hypothetical protein
LYFKVEGEVRKKLFVSRTGTCRSKKRTIILCLL